jgi:protein-disulfide isomerase/uncharacterized membrane protein
MRPQRAAWLCLLLSIVGIGLSGYLAFLHLGLLRGELLGGSACSGSGAFNCHAVTAGAWGSFLGMPLAFWGVIGYVAVFALSLLALQSAEWSARAISLLFALSVLCVLADLVLFGLMVFVIRFYCLFCLLTYGVNLALLLISACSLPPPRLAAIRQVGSSLAAVLPSRERSAAGLFWAVIIVGILGTVGTHLSTLFVSQGPFGAMRKQIREFASRQPRVNPTIAGDPELGPANAPVQIIEFSDFFCPSCQRASQLNRIILANHRHDVRFVFKHFPLDTACNDKVSRMVHPGACQVAAASECAHLQGRFWAFHDLVFEQSPKYNASNIDADVARLGLDMSRFRACMDSAQGLEAVKLDIAEAAKVGVGSTPTYVLNGLPITGGLSPSVFDEFVSVLRETSH